MISTPTSSSLRPSFAERTKRNTPTPFRWSGAVLALGLLIASCGDGGTAKPSGSTPGEASEQVTSTEQAAPSQQAGPAPEVTAVPVQTPRAKIADTPALVGFHLTGRVVDPWSDSVKGAVIRVVPAGAGESGETLAQGVSDEQGTYELELPSAGPFQIYARHAQGFDLLTTYELDEGTLNKMKNLHLAGEGMLGGRVLDAEGNPVSDTIITVFSRDLLHEVLLRGDERFELDAYPIAAPTLEGAFYEPGRGFRHAVTVTAADGGFFFKGLIPGEYMFYCSAVGSLPWMRAQRDWTQTGALDIELRSEICLLEVGVGLDGLPGSITGKESNSRRLGPVEVFPSVPTEQGPRPLLGRAVPSYGGERNVFGLEPGHYFVRATTYPPEGLMGGTMHVEGQIQLKPGEALRRADLEFPAVDRPTGRLRVTAESPAGWDAPVGFHLLTPWTLQELECSELTPYPKMVFDEWLEVPEGEYVIALMPFRDYIGQPDVVSLARCYRRVTVVAGEDVESVLRGVLGGHMRVTLDADRFVLGKDLVFPEDMLDGDSRALMSLFEQTIGAVITIVREDGGPALKLRLRDRLSRLTPERRSMLPGEVMENFVPLDPGNYTVWAQAPGFVTSSAPLTITSGETSNVTIRLETPK